MIPRLAIRKCKICGRGTWNPLLVCNLHPENPESQSYNPPVGDASEVPHVIKTVSGDEYRRALAELSALRSQVRALKEERDRLVTYCHDKLPLMDGCKNAFEKVSSAARDIVVLKAENTNLRAEVENLKETLHSMQKSDTLDT